MNRCSRCGLRLLPDATACPFDGAEPTPRVSVGQTEAPDGSSRQRSLEAAGWAVDGELGRGGFATVHAARRIGDGASVALKVSHAGSRGAADALFTEALVLQALQGRHAPPLLDKGITDDGSYFIAMGRQHTTTLAAVLASAAGPVPLPEFRRLALGVIDAVQTLHQRGLVHRDLKPENIFVAPSGEVTLIDFGLTSLAAPAVQVDAGMRSDAPPKPPGADDAGTAEYMSPEQCLGQPSDARSDIYALGVMLYELLSGAPPFWGSDADVRDAQMARSPTPLSAKTGCPALLGDLIGTCLAKLPRERPADVAVLRQALTRACDAIDPAWSAARAHLDPHAPAASAPAASSEELSAILLYFRSVAATAELGRLAARLGGLIAYERGDAKVALFDHESASAPAEAALAFARRLQRATLTSHARLHAAKVTSRTLRGRRTIFGAVLSQADLTPGADDPEGVVVSADVVYMLRGHGFEPVEGRTDVLLVADSDDATWTTHRQAEVALIGREPELAALTNALANCLSQRRAALCTVLGGAGLGKTLLAMEALRHLEGGADLHKISVAAQPGDGSRLFVKLLRLALDPPLAAPADGGRESLTQHLGEVGAQTWPAVALQLGWIDLNHPDVARMAAAPGALRLAAARALGEALRRLARRRPLALIIDDAHLADDATLDAVEYATLAESDTPLWMGMFARPQLTMNRKTWGVRAASGFMRELPPLGPSESEALLRGLLSEVWPLPDHVLRLLHQRTQGVPGNMVDFVRGLKLAGVVRRRPGGSGSLLATDELERLPDTPVVEWNALQQLRRLPDNLLLTVQLSSVLGSPFSFMELAAVQRDRHMRAPGEVWLDPWVALRSLRHRGLLSFADEVYRFSDPLLGELIYKRMPPELRTGLHAVALGVRNELPLTQLERLARDARHARGRGDLERATHASLALATELAARHDYRDAERAYSNALTSLGACRDARYVQAARGLGAMRWRLSRHAEAIEQLVEARQVAHALHDDESEAHLLLDEAMARDFAFDFEASARLSAQASEMTCDTPLIQARRLLALSRSAMRQGRLWDCVELGLRSAELAETLEGDGYETLVIATMMVGFSLAAQSTDTLEAEGASRLRRALELTDRAVQLASSRGDPIHLATALCNRCTVHLALGNEQQVLTDIDESIRVSREAGLNAEALSRWNRVEYLLTLGRYAAAAAEIHTLRALADALGMTAIQSSIRLTLARVAFRQGDLVQAAQQCKLLRASLDATEDAPLMTDETKVFGALEFLLSETNAARVEAFAHRFDCSQLQALDYGEVLENLADRLETLGSPEAADAVRRKAIDFCARHGAPLTSKRILQAAPRRC